MSTRRPLRLLSIPTIGGRRLRESSFIQKAGVRSNTSRVNTSFVTITVTVTATVTAIQTGNLPERPLPQRPSLVGRSHPSFGGHGFLKSEIPFGLNQLGCAPLGAATLSWNSSVCLRHNMSEVGQTRTSAADLTTSALPPKTHIARQIGFIVRSPTTRRSILLIRSEPSTSAALMAAGLSGHGLTFYPNDTAPPRLIATGPMAPSWLVPN